MTVVLKTSVESQTPRIAHVNTLEMERRYTAIFNVSLSWDIPWDISLHNERCVKMRNKFDKFVTIIQWTRYNSSHLTSAHWRSCLRRSCSQLHDSLLKQSSFFFMLHFFDVLWRLRIIQWSVTLQPSNKSLCSLSLFKLNDYCIQCKQIIFTVRCQPLVDVQFGYCYRGHLNKVKCSIK